MGESREKKWNKDVDERRRYAERKLFM